MTEVYRQARVLLTHPLAHALLALLLTCVLFALFRHYYKARQFKRAAIPAVGMTALVYVEAQLHVLHATRPPHYWLLGRDLPVHLLLTLAVVFAAFGIVELKQRRTWQGHTNLTMAHGLLALTAGILRYAYAWPVIGVSVIVFLTLLLTIFFATVATFGPRRRPLPAPGQLHHV